MEKTFLINQLKFLLKHENIRKIETGQGDDYTTGYLLDYNHFVLIITIILKLILLEI